MTRKHYFKEKFYEDELYPEPKEYLLTHLKALKTIKYDRTCYRNNHHFITHFFG